METLRWTVDDLKLLPEDGSRYEIIDGELYVPTQPHMYHQIVIGNVFDALKGWSKRTRLGKALFTPGVILTNDNAVVPDVDWISNERFATALQVDGKLHSCPELVVEILSPGLDNERRDREIKLKLYSRRNAKEYWVVDWQKRNIEIYRRENAALTLEKTLNESDIIESPLLPGFRCRVSELFEDI